jgi:hypothetical protein
VRRFKSGIQFLYMRALEVNGGIPASLVLPRHLPAQMLALRISLSLTFLNSILTSPHGSGNI